MSALYVYGLLTGQPSAALGAGVGGGPVTTRQAGPLTALVSPIAPGPVPQTRRNMIAHTSVLERAIAQADVLPLRFGTVAPDGAALVRCVLSNEGNFQQALAGIAGCVELGVKASWRPGIVFNDIVSGNPTLERLRDRLRQKPANETYYERVELGRQVETALATRRATETAALMAALRPGAERDTALRLPDDDMLFNQAFLVRRDQESAFDERVQAAAAQHAGRLDFKYVGPVPPYNFVNLQVGWLAAA
jgi:hypothetical protein